MSEEQTARPAVSILIPVFNRQPYIADCIRSALTQTWTDLEVVVVDNASTDDTWEICQQIAAEDTRVRLFRNEINIGPVRNWLHCVDKARGEYGKFLFSDDLMRPGFLKYVMPYMRDPDTGFVATAALIGNDPESGNIQYQCANTDKPIALRTYFSLLLEGKLPYSPGAAIFRMADIRANLHPSFPTHTPCDFAKNGAGPDVLLFALTALNYRQIVMLPRAEVFFRIHAGSFTITDADNEVSQGYKAALSWFCMTRLERAYWVDYVARTWLVTVRQARRWCGLRRYCMTYEGSGKLPEAASVLFRAMYLAIRKFLQRAVQ